MSAADPVDEDEVQDQLDEIDALRSIWEDDADIFEPGANLPSEGTEADDVKAGHEPWSFALNIEVDGPDDVRFVVEATDEEAVPEPRDAPPAVAAGAVAAPPATTTSPIESKVCRVAGKKPASIAQPKAEEEKKKGRRRRRKRNPKKKKVCRFWNPATQSGCRAGAACRFEHVGCASATAAATKPNAPEAKRRDTEVAVAAASALPPAPGAASASPAAKGASMPPPPLPTPARRSQKRLRRVVTNRARVSCLPPIRVGVRMVRGYPSTTPPELEVSCLWLSDEVCGKLRAECVRLWDEARFAILYTFAEWLRSEALDFLLDLKDDVVSRLDEKHLVDDGSEPPFLIRLPQPPKLAAPAPVASSAAWRPRPRAALAMVTKYAHEQERAKFERATHECGICMDDRPGSDMRRVEPCGHAFCKPCFKSFCELHTKEGSVQRLCCPEEGCDVPLPPALLREFLTPELLERWERVTLKRSLEQMADVSWCPRCESAVVEAGGKDNFAMCAACGFAFCTLCTQVYHPGVKCLDDRTRLELMRAKAQGLGKTKAVAAVREKILREVASLQEVMKNSKQCPNCKVAISKTAGCNKMTCALCDSKFCYRCGKDITREGYDHFKQSACPLFEADAEQEWNRQQQMHQAGGGGFAGAGGGRRPRQQRDVLGLGGMDLNVVLRMNPWARRYCVPCPHCRSQNMKQDRNNHMRCRQCGHNYCFRCRCLIPKGNTSHFTAQHPQHSDH